MKTRLCVSSLALAATMGLALNAHAETAPSTSKAVATSPAGSAKHSSAPHHKTAHHAAHAAHATHAVYRGPAHRAHRVAARWIERDAAAQSRIAADLGHGRLAPQKVALLQTQAADLYRSEAQYLQSPINKTAALRVASLERDLMHAVAQAERERDHEGRASADRLDRMHARVATWRDAEQQRWIAQEVRHGRLSLEQAAALEHEQARIVAAQATLESRGHESVDDALRMQHLQNVQDWAIRTAHAWTPMSA
jgi:hypothetical protein